MPNDATLLRRYAQTQDADAFSELVQRHAGLVYAVCLRVAGSSHDAEDVAQECFMELARNAHAIRSSLPGWLHVVATRRAVDAIRRSATRRRHEEEAMSHRETAPNPTWPEIAPHFDAALASLPEHLRVPIVLHHLQGRGQSDVASELGVSQSTVWRRLDKGMNRLRSRLKKAGIIVASGALATLVAESAIADAPAGLLTALAKIGVAGVAGASASATVATAASSTAASAPLGTLSAKIAAALVATVVVVGGIVTYRMATGPEKEQPAMNGPSQKEQLIAAADATQRAPLATYPKAASLDNVPHGAADSNSFARGLEVVLNYVGTETDYDTLMGDSGQAFIIQSEEGGPLLDGAVDVGWWPLDSWNMKARVGFVSKAVGRQIRWLPCDVDEYHADPAGYYRNHYELAVKESIAVRRPLVAQIEPAFVVTGYDEQEPPLLGDCSLRDEVQTNRIEEYPCGLVVLGEATAPMNRRQADLEALSYAVALGRDTADPGGQGGSPARGRWPSGRRRSATWSTSGRHAGTPTRACISASTAAARLPISARWPRDIPKRSARI